MTIFSQPWFPLVFAYSLVMIVALMALHFMSRQRFAGHTGELLMVVFMSTGMMLLVWVPIPWVIKIFPALCLSLIGARLTKAHERSGYLMGQCWVALFFYIIGVSGVLLK